MSKDHIYLNTGEDSIKGDKSPRDSSIVFIKQFARAYSGTHGVEFSYCILN